MSNNKAQILKQRLRLRLSFFSTLALTSTLDLFNLTLNFDIWILAFGIAFVEVVVCPFGQLIETVF